MNDQIPSTRTTETRKEEYPSPADKKDYSSDVSFFDEEMDKVIDRLNELQFMLHSKKLPDETMASLGETVGFVIDLKYGLSDFFHELTGNEEAKESEEKE